MIYVKQSCEIACFVGKYKNKTIYMANGDSEFMHWLL